VEFRDSIRPPIPQIIALLRHYDSNVLNAGVDALAKLSDHGKL
jgi:hypothetical protein